MLSENFLFALNDIDEAYLEETVMIHSAKCSSRTVPTPRTVSRIILIAAAIAALFSITAFAISYFSMSGREAYTDEKYYTVWDESETGYLTWTDLTYVLKFSGSEECMGVKFKEGWLPFAPSEQRNAWACDEDGWRTNLVSETAPEVDSMSDNYQPYRVDLFYAPQFINDGALVMLDQMPGEITEEQWGDEQVMKFTATRHQNAFDDDELDIHIPEKDMHYYFVIRFHPGKGYILVVSGTSDMQTIEHIARELQIKETDEVIRSSDFVNNCTFIDVGQG